MRYAALSLSLAIAFALGVVVGMLIPVPGREVARKLIPSDDAEAPAISMPSGYAMARLIQLVDEGRAAEGPITIPLDEWADVLRAEFDWTVSRLQHAVVCRTSDDLHRFRFQTSGTTIDGVAYAGPAASWGGSDDERFLEQVRFVQLCSNVMGIPETVSFRLISAARFEALLKGHDALALDGKMINAWADHAEIRLSITRQGQPRILSP